MPTPKPFSQDLYICVGAYQLQSPVLKGPLLVSSTLPWDWVYLGMVISSPRLEEFEARYQREAYQHLTYQEALSIFLALWVEARTLRPDLGSDWREDIKSDIAVARALNGLSPAA